MLTLATVLNCIGIGLQRGTQSRWQLMANDGTGAPALNDERLADDPHRRAD